LYAPSGEIADQSPLRVWLSGSPPPPFVAFAMKTRLVHEQTVADEHKNMAQFKS
jgi:hypothetical protein